MQPSGSVYSHIELTALADVLETPSYVVADGIYEHINFQGLFCSIASIRMLERAITVKNGVIKLLP
jgi:aspartate/methionine/tyrosine aminotransferase